MEPSFVLVSPSGALPPWWPKDDYEPVIAVVKGSDPVLYRFYGNRYSDCLPLTRLYPWQRWIPAMRADEV